jgi:hypothetical protein
LVKPVERFIQDLVRRCEIKAQPVLAARAELRAGAGEDTRAVRNAVGDIFRG